MYFCFVAVGVLITSICSAGMVMIIVKNQVWFAMRSETSILHVITGRYLDPSMCVTYFSWPDPYPVGETLTFIVKVSASVVDE